MNNERVHWIRRNAFPVASYEGRVKKYHCSVYIRNLLWYDTPVASDGMNRDDNNHTTGCDKMQMQGFEEIEKDRDVVRKFATWLSGPGQKYVTVIPFDCSLSDIAKAIKSVLRHDHINAKMAERIRRIAR